jgi:hypothetical protein
MTSPAFNYDHWRQTEELARLRDEKNEAQRQEHMAKAGEERLRRLVLKAAAASDPKVALDRLAREALMADDAATRIVVLEIQVEELEAELARAQRERERYLVFVEDMLNARDPDVRRRAREALDG